MSSCFCLHIDGSTRGRLRQPEARASTPCRASEDLRSRVTSRHTTGLDRVFGNNNRGDSDSTSPLFEPRETTEQAVSLVLGLRAH
ncbi:hypothetical protein DPMN_158106 [Dreissena polymorpha]|uniref:Uncharacterized protein n=1 Tax=Dreissena polymorpha TaxID=45954 RepID=A0A9D4EIK9_DREPO|nr:hypothetical protein DPMN_158106 [Dreissena polymorpha]